jgi:hypothetical protein
MEWKASKKFRIEICSLIDLIFMWLHKITVSIHILTYAPFINVYSSDLPTAVCHIQISHKLLPSFDIFCIPVAFEYRNVLIR